MTEPQRNHVGTRRGSIITGLRCEPDLARRLRDAAREQTEKGDIAVTARYLLHTQLGLSDSDAHHMEQTMLKPARLCGLALPTKSYLDLERRARREGLTITATARHLLRLALEVSHEESFRREETFTSLAAALKEVREAHR